MGGVDPGTGLSSRNSRCTQYSKTTDGGHVVLACSATSSSRTVTMMEHCGAYGRTGMYLFTRPGSPAVEDTTNVKRGDGREIIKSHTSIGNLEYNLIWFWA
jgi:hypothetical protein